MESVMRKRCVAKLSQNAFAERYQKWRKRHVYNFTAAKAAEIHGTARTLFPLVLQSCLCGKPYVYMTAGANKLLRIYYGFVMSYLQQLER